MLIAHGDRERYTDPRKSYAYALRAKGRGVRICRFDVHGAGHFMIDRVATGTAWYAGSSSGSSGIEPEDPVIANASAAALGGRAAHSPVRTVRSVIDNTTASG